MLNIYVSKPFQRSKQSPIQARFLKHCHLGKSPSQFHFQLKMLNFEFIWCMGYPPLLDKHIIIHNIEERMDIPLIIYLPFWTLYDVTQDIGIHCPLGKLGMKLVDNYGIPFMWYSKQLEMRHQLKVVNKQSHYRVTTANTSPLLCAPIWSAEVFYHRHMGNERTSLELLDWNSWKPLQQEELWHNCLQPNPSFSKK
jgi:hypothetical protein